jgi:tartrate-resistant acid phosphatase type 5
MKLRNRFLPVPTIILILIFNLLYTNLYPQSANESSKQLTLGEKSLNFLVLSDWGRDGIDDTTKKAPGQIKVAKQLGLTAKEINASFVVTCGDNFHGHGVTSSTDPFFKVNFENVYTDKSLMIPWYITLGNHDYEGNVDGELEYAKTSSRWTQPARYYSFTKKLPDSTEVLFVVLDSSPLIGEYINSKADEHHVKNINNFLQAHWCDSVLSKSNNKWKFVFYHHPAYSASSTHGSTKEIQDFFVPLFEKYHVTACFSGHDHDLQHSHPANATVEYFGTGGGSETRPVGQADFTKFSKESLGFSVVSLTQNIMRLTFVNELGEQIYTYEIYK